MKIYFAGHAYGIEREIGWFKDMRRKLISYYTHVIETDNFKEILSFIKNENISCNSNKAR